MYQIQYPDTITYDFPLGYKHCKLQKIVLAFHNSPAQIAKIVIPPEEYASLKSAGCSFRTAIKRVKLDMLVRTIKGSIYLIKY